ncbi:MAG: hypothetical protein AABY22_02450 [Nanoarchaeota archaeon]
MKSKKAASNTWMIVASLIVIGLIAYAVSPTFQVKVDGLFGGTSTPAPEQLNTDTCPSDGTTSWTIQTPDALASTATNVNAEIYIFDGDALTKSVTSSSGSATADLTCGKVYKAIALNTTTKLGAYAKKFDLDSKQAFRYSAQRVSFRLSCLFNGSIEKGSLRKAFV